MDGNLSRNFFQLGNMMRIDNAFVIITQGRRPQQMSAVTIDRIASVDRRNGFVYTGVRNNENFQTRFDSL